MQNEYKWRGILPLALSACLLTSIVSCGGDSSYGSGGGSSQREEQTSEGVFTAALSPENASVSNAAGNASVSIIGDDLTAEVVLAGAKTGTHAQHIHTGTRCPTPADDTNGDGVVDATEATAVYGGVLLGLDSDLAGSAGNFPSGIAYNYDQSASVAQILTNLGLSALAIEGKVINIHGVPDSTVLPATIQGGKAAFPISCGVLTRAGDSTTSAAASASSAASTAAAAATDVTSAASSAETAATAATAAAASSTGGSSY